MQQALLQLGNAHVDFSKQKVIIQPGKEVTLHVYAQHEKDIEDQVKEIFEKENIVYKVLRKDFNKELFITFDTEDQKDKALEILTSSDCFGDEEGNRIIVGYATDSVLETVLKNIITITQ